MSDTPETRAARIVWLLRENCLDACTEGLFGRLENTIAREIREALSEAEEKWAVETTNKLADADTLARAEQREEDADWLAQRAKLHMHKDLRAVLDDAAINIRAGGKP